jgi:hypothetical protein
MGSQAYTSFKTRMLNFSHRPYEKRILAAIGKEVLGKRAELMRPATLQIWALEISWVPTHLFVFQQPDTHHLSLLDRFKGCIENATDENWNWSPLEPRLRPIREGYRRLQWKSLHGNARHVDVQWHTRDALEVAFGSAPAYVEQIDAELEELLQPTSSYIQRVAKLVGL